MLLAFLALVARLCGAELEPFRYTHFLGRALRFDNIEQRVCEPEGGGVVCDPVVIMAGRGHTGSANLAAFLQNHTELSFGTTKEHRFFSGRSVGTVDRYRRQFDIASAAERRFGFDATPAYERHPARIFGLLPRVKVLLAVRDEVDHGMSQLYISDGDEFHAWTRKHLLPSSVDKFQRRWCAYGIVDAFVRTFGRDQVLVLASETLRNYRDEVLDDIQRFVGVSRERPRLPVVAICKRERYKGRFGGCYNGTSKVLPQTRALWAPLFAECHANLENLLQVRPGTLFNGGPTVKRSNGFV
ncbi:P-loop containing nucleoside triphosphate hydrolase protein [Pelagophyceae sp. CCMP2097]|nr:P-loop containing nucleoside triphosphate hydrolase protein [Pelagophyceae sp. CCMP2097]